MINYNRKLQTKIFIKGSATFWEEQLNAFVEGKKIINIQLNDDTILVIYEID